jgi:hypothetical protein
MIDKSVNIGGLIDQSVIDWLIGQFDWSVGWLVGQLNDKLMGWLLS